MNPRKYKVGDNVLRTNCYGITNNYVVIALDYSNQLEQHYYTLAYPLKSGKLPKRTCAVLVHESELTMQSKSQAKL